MSTIQVLGREAVDDRSNQANEQLKRQEMAQSAMEKSIQFKQMGEQLRLQAKNNDNEVEKVKILRMGNTMDYLAKGSERVSKSATPEKDWANFIKMSSKYGLLDQLGTKEMSGMIEAYAPTQSAEAGQQTANANLVNKIARQMGGQSGNANNQPSANAVSGAVPSQGDDSIGWSSFSPPGSGLQLENYGGQARGAAMKTIATEQAKPLTKEEGQTYAASKTIGLAIDEINKLVDKGVFDSTASQLAVDLGQPLAVPMASANTKDALNYMNHLKNLIPFARGGKQLTPFEAKLVFRLINTAGKTRTQIKRDLNVYKQEFQTMVKSMTTPRGQLGQEDLDSLVFGGGKSYEDLTVNSSKQDNAPKKTKMIGGYEVSY